MNSENKFNIKHFLVIISIVFIGIPIGIFIMIGLIRLGLIMFSWLPERYMLYFINTENFIINFNDLLNLCFVTLGISVTSIFSYLIWTANKQSAEVANKLSEIEINRDLATVKQSSAVLFYSAESGLNYIYETYSLKKTIISPRYAENWISYLDKLYGYISIEKIKLFYTLYSSLLNLENNELKSTNPQTICKQHCKIIDECFDRDFLEYSNYLSRSSITSNKVVFDSIFPLLNMKYYLLFQDLRQLFQINSKSQIYSSEFTRKEFYPSGELFCEISYKGCDIIHKKCWDTSGNFLENCSYVSGRKTGFVKIYKNSDLHFEGYVENDEKINGTEYRIKIRDSRGFDLFENEAWLRRQIDETSDEEYEEYQQKLLDEAISNNRIDWEEFCTGIWRNGERELLSNSFKEQLFN